MVPHILPQNDHDRPLRLTKLVRLHRSRFLELVLELARARGENEDVPWPKIRQILFDLVHGDVTLESIVCDCRWNSSTACISMEIASRVAAAILYTFAHPQSSPQQRQAFVEERNRLLPRLQAARNVSNNMWPPLDSEPLRLLALGIGRYITTTHETETCEVHEEELEKFSALPNTKEASGELHELL